MTELTTQVLVVGAGPAGCATALSLLRAGISEVLLVSADGFEQGGAGDGVPPHFGALLEALGLDEPPEAIDCHGSYVWWGSEGLRVEDHWSSMRGLSRHVARAQFDPWLRRQVAKRGAQLRCDNKVVAVESRRRGGWLVQMRDKTGESLRVAASFVVDATGRRAWLARRLGARLHGHDRLLASYLECGLRPGPLARYSHLQAAPFGYLYAGALPKARVLLSIFFDADGLPSELSPSRVAAASELMKIAVRYCPHLEAQLQPLPVSTVRVQSARSQHLDRCGGENWLAVGDAAMAFDPLSASGIYNAMADGLTAGLAIARAGVRGIVVNDAQGERLVSCWKRYQMELRQHYRAERRWRAHPFWARRHETAAC